MYKLWAFLMRFCAGISLWFSPIITKEFNRFSTGGEGVDDGHPDGLTDGSNDVWMEGSFPRELDFWEFRSSNTPGYFHHEFS